MERLKRPVKAAYDRYIELTTSVRDRLAPRKQETDLVASQDESHDPWPHFHEYYSIDASRQDRDASLLEPLSSETLDSIKPWTLRDDDKDGNSVAAQATTDLPSAVPEKGIVRLMNWKTKIVESFEAGNLPPYVAISHVCSEYLFPASAVGSPSQAPGFQQISLFLEARADRYSHIWVDAWCINQDDEEDKRLQILQMSSIYQDADKVLIIFQQPLQFGTSEWEHVMRRLEGAFERYNDLDRRLLEFEAFVKEHRLGHDIIRAMEMIDRLANLHWNKRIWTAQEYVLARSTVFIGPDRVDLVVQPEQICTLIDMWRLVIEEGISDGLGSVEMFKFLNELASKKRDPTEVMMLAENRSSTLVEDEILGLMAASTVQVDPSSIDDGGLEGLWKTWWQKAIEKGHFHWALLPKLDSASEPQHPMFSNCLMPSFKSRCRAAREGQYFKSQKPLGTFQLDEAGALEIKARFVGLCEFSFAIGTINKTVEYPCDLSMVLTKFTAGHTARICAAMTSGKLSSKGVQTLAERVNAYHQLLDGSKRIAADAEEIGKLLEECLNGDNLKRSINSHVKGPTYLATLKSEHKSTEILIVSHDFRSPRPGSVYIAVDPLRCEPSDPVESRWRSLLILEGYRDRELWHFPFHKVATTYPVLVSHPGLNVDIATDYNIHISDMPVKQFTVGGRRCCGCLLDCMLHELNQNAGNDPNSVGTTSVLDSSAENLRLIMDLV